MALLAGASIIIGNLLALRQDNVKRLLAYSSIAHLGYLMIAVIAGGANGGEAAAFYLAAYVPTTPHRLRRDHRAEFRRPRLRPRR